MARPARSSPSTLALLGEHVRPGVTTASSTGSPRSSSARRAASRRSRATAATRRRSAPRRTTWSSTASPAAYALAEGDILSVDVGVTLGGFVADSAYTFPVGEISAEAERLLEACEAALAAGIEQAGPGTASATSRTRCRRVVEEAGLLRRPQPRRPRRRALDARGPADPELRRAGPRPAARGGDDARDRADDQRRRRRTSSSHDDQWSISTADGSLSAHFEHTVAVTDDGPADPDAGGAAFATIVARRAAVLACAAFCLRAGHVGQGREDRGRRRGRRGAPEHDVPRPDDTATTCSRRSPGRCARTTSASSRRPRQGRALAYDLTRGRSSTAQVGAE